MVAKVKEKFIKWLNEVGTFAQGCKDWRKIRLKKSVSKFRRLPKLSDNPNC